MTKAKLSALLSFGLCVFLMIVLIIVLTARCSTGKGDKPDKTERKRTESVEMAPEDTPEPENERKSGFLGLPVKEEPTPEPTATPEPTPSPTPEPVGPLIEEQPEPAPEGYFADAAFVGNSLVTGLDMYDYNDVLAGADFYAANSVTILGVGDYIAQMAGHTYGKVYIGLGTNEMSYDKDELRRCYADTIATLKGYNPDCIIVLMSVTPVSKYKSETNSMFTRLLVLEYNQMLMEIAAEQGVWYLDETSVLCDEEGFLPSDVTVDGVHFTPQHYEYWFEYLTTHYVPVD